MYAWSAVVEIELGGWWGLSCRRFESRGIVR